MNHATEHSLRYTVESQRTQLRQVIAERDALTALLLGLLDAAPAGAEWDTWRALATPLLAGGATDDAIRAAGGR
jgi:hypothetical protein